MHFDDGGDYRESRLCAGCGYDLRGLPTSGVCPECGVAKTVPYGASLGDSLSLSPIEIIQVFRIGSLAVSGAMIAAIAMFVRSMLLIGHPTVNAVLLLVIAIAWFGAVWLGTPSVSDKAAIARGFGVTGRLRIAARFLQLGWVLAGVVLVLREVLPSPSPVPQPALAAMQWMLTGVGLAGVWCFALLMERLAEWTRDEFAERMFNWSLWGIPLGTPPLLLVNVGGLLGWSYTALMMRGPAVAVVIVLGLAWIAALLTFPLAMASLTKSVALSAVHHREHEDRQRRRAARMMEYDARISESIEKLNPQPRR